MDETPSNPMPICDNNLQPEYRFDYQKAKPNRFAVGNSVEKLKVVVLDDDVAQVFTTPKAVNKALRALIEAMPQPQ
ncbi:hypothetical protein GFS31_17860 [Leptolyngbya sp. BL0902]|uniref:hypothetical protein n=1 Tax=Leptolyngbya sp. BL0902 TaxID=1115757 RepID=UPI0018E816DC|nr:hypothetical protein [Leptolyngbya sp. BL0902]QQE65101.1 hypothetical protein GFS31_17860 [Leptolyngbya sp. BL0902]